MRRRESRLRRAVTSIARTAAMGGALAALIAPAVAQAASGTTITVAANQTDGTISPGVMGSTYLAPFGGMGSFDSATDSFWPSFIGDLQSQVYTGSLRWPGGITSQYYDFRRAIGPQAQRTDNPYGPASGPSDSTVGPDEFGQLLDSTGAEGISTVNFATGDPTEAAEFVQYMTGAEGSSPYADMRAANGHPQPYDVPVWEVGNEEYTTASSWRAGTVVSIGGPTGACTADAATCQYIYGGSDSFSNQPVVGYADRRASAADSTGAAGQSFYVAYPPIQAGSQTIYVAGTEWTAVSSAQLASAAPTADDYVVDDATGAITFGNGTNGAVPPSGDQITASYISGPHSGFNDFYAAMKAANPNIQVCSTDTATAFIQAMGSSLPYDCLQVHPYVSGNNASADISTFEDTVMSAPDSELANVQAWESQIQSAAGHSIPLVLTEYGSLISATPDPTDYPYYDESLDEALLNASQLSDWINDGIQVADRQLLDAEEPAAGAVAEGLPNGAPDAVTGAILTPGPNTVVEPTGQYFELFKPLAGGDLVNTTTSGNPLLSGTSTGALSVTAALGSDGNTDVVVINRDPDNPVSSTLQVNAVGSGATAALTTLNGPSALSYNSASAPDTVTTSTSTATVSDGSVALTFPAHSITLVSVPTGPTASFTEAQAPGGLAVQFTDTSSALGGTRLTSWAWSFGDGGTSTAENPTHTYSAAGAYTVSLTVTESDGKTTTFQTPVTVAAVPAASVPPPVVMPLVTSSTAPAAGATTAKSRTPSRPPTAAQIRKRLLASLTPVVKQRSVTALLKRGLFKATFAVPEAGRLLVDWYAKPAGHKHRVLIASHRARYTRKHTATLRIRLTTAGRKLLRGAKRVNVTAEDHFTPKGTRVITATRRFTLVAKRG